VSEAVVIALIIAGVIGFLVWRARAPGKARRNHVAELTRMCGGNAEQARRLILGEQARAEGISDQEAARRAVRAWRYDMR